MDYVDQALEKISGVAEANEMEAFLTGVYMSSDESDPRLLKIAPKGLRTEVLLELDFHWRQMRIYKHRTADLTAKYRGNPVSIEWAIGFIEANRQHAKDLLQARTAAHLEEIDQREAEPHIPKPNGQELKKRRMLVSCKCRGEVEKCVRCQGSGQYWTDGLGNLI